MKHTLHFYLSFTLLLSGILSFAGKNTNDNFACPTAIISYAGTPFCASDANVQAVTLTGTDAYLGGVFYSTSGLVLNSTTGEISPSISTPGTYVITYVIAADGSCSAVNATTTVTILPNNTVSSASSTPTLCVNTPLTPITHTTTGATGIIQSGLPAGVTATLSANTIMIAGTPVMFGVYNYSIPLTGGCGTVYATGTIVVLPNNTVSSASSTPTLCINTPLTPITHNVTGATGMGTPTGLPMATTASWSGNTITITGSPIAAGVFNYSIPLTGGCGTVNATGTITVTMASNAGADGNISICENNSTINLFDIISGEDSGGTWTRTTGSGGTFNAATGTFTSAVGATTSSFSYTVIGTPPCSNDTSMATININPAPTGITISGGTTTCAGNPVNLTVTGTPGTVITWTAGSGTNTLTINPSGTATFSVSPTVTTTYTLTSASLNGCSIPLNQSVTVIVNQTPGSPIGLPTMNICSGETTNLFISASPNVAGTIFEWTVTDSQNVTGFTTNGTMTFPLTINDVLINTSNAPGFVKYSVTTKLGNCEGGTTIYTIYVQPLPNSILTDGSICVDATTGVPYQSYILDTQISNLNLNFNFDWFLLNTTTNMYDQIVGANASTYEATVAGSYQVIVTNIITSCINLASAYVIETFPATEISTTVSDTSNPTITVTVNPIGTGNLIYALDNGAWQESNVFSGVVAGSHIVQVSDLEGCTNLSAEVVINEVLTDLVMYPNPTFESLSFNNKNKVISVQISNQMGQIILYKDLNMKTGSIDLSDLNVGIYNIVFDTESGIINQRIIKQ